MICSGCGTPIPGYPCYRCGRVSRVSGRPSVCGAAFVALLSALSSGCGGGGGGGGSSTTDPGASPVAHLAGSWSLIGTHEPGSGQPCADLGLESAVLQFELRHALIDKDTYVGIYDINAASWGTESLASPGESTLVAVALADDEIEGALFLGGLYYDSARDETVEINAELVPLPVLTLGSSPMVFELVASYASYAGYHVIADDSSLKGFDDDADGEVDEPDEVDLDDVIDPGVASVPDCAGEIRLVGTAQASSSALLLRLLAVRLDDKGNVNQAIYMAPPESIGGISKRGKDGNCSADVAQDALRVWRGRSKMSNSKTRQ